MPTDTDTEQGYKRVGDNGQPVTELEQLIKASMREVDSTMVSAQMLQLRESEFLRFDLARDDVGWQKLASASNLDMTPGLRQNSVWRARQFARFDGIIKQTLALYRNFAIGPGMTWQVAEEKDDAGNTIESPARPILTDLTSSTWNRQIFSTQGQQELSNALYTDGEAFFVFFAGPEGVKIRTIDPMEIQEIATNPEDKTEARLYERVFFVGTKKVTRIYRDWMNLDPGAPAITSTGRMLTAGDSNAEFVDAPIYHVKLQGRGLRGETGLMTDMDWASQYRKFMTARVAVALAIAAFVHKLKTQGTQAQLDALKAKLGTGINTTTSDGENNPPAVAGSMFLENESATLTSMKQETGAASAKVDSGLILNQATIGSGMFVHYYGVDNSFRLATATSMEPPMFKAFSSYQELWRDTWLNIFQWVLREEQVDEDEIRKVEVLAPPIREQDVAPLIDSIQKTVQTFPELSDSPAVEAYMLTLLGMKNADEIIKSLDELAEAMPDRNLRLKIHQVVREIAQNQ
jgi:hypothetical protein